MSEDKRLMEAITYANETNNRLVHITIEFASFLVAKLRIDAGRIAHLEQALATTAPEAGEDAQ